MANPLLLLGNSKPVPAAAPATPIEQGIVRGEISKVEGGMVHALVREFSHVYNFGPLRVIGGWSPVIGEECLIVFDQDSIGYALWGAGLEITGGATGPEGPAGHLRAPQARRARRT